MTVNWTQEPAQAEQPAHPHNALAWTLWGLAALVIVTWVLCMAFGIALGGRVHLLLALFAVLTIINVILGFRSVEYFVPLRLTGRFFRGWGGRSNPPRTPSGTMNEAATRHSAGNGDILPGNDPVSGPGQRKAGNADPMP